MKEATIFVILSIFFARLVGYYYCLCMLSKKYFFLSILISALAFLFTFEGVNVQHVYYQILILPAVAIFVALGVDFVYKNNKYFINPFLFQRMAGNLHYRVFYLIF